MNMIETSFASIFTARHTITPPPPPPLFKSINILGILFANVIVGLVHSLLLLVLFGYYHFFFLELILQLSASKNLIRISSVFYSRIRFSRRYRVIVTLITWKRICVFPRQTAHGV